MADLELPENCPDQPRKAPGKALLLSGQHRPYPLPVLYLSVKLSTPAADKSSSVCNPETENCITQHVEAAEAV